MLIHLRVRLFERSVFKIITIIHCSLQASVGGGAAARQAHLPVGGGGREERSRGALLLLFFFVVVVFPIFENA